MKNDQRNGFAFLIGETAEMTMTDGSSVAVEIIQRYRNRSFVWYIARIMSWEEAPHMHGDLVPVHEDKLHRVEIEDCCVR